MGQNYLKRTHFKAKATITTLADSNVHTLDFIGYFENGDVVDVVDVDSKGNIVSILADNIQISALNPATKKVVLDAIQHVPGFVPDPAPTVVFHTFAGSSIDMTSYFWIDTAKTDLFAAKDAAFELVKAALDEQGIEIPFPITTVFTQSGS